MSGVGLIAVLALVLAGFLSAQTARFEVASVKPGAPNDPNAFLQFQQGGRLVIRNIPARDAVDVLVVDSVDKPSPD